MRGFYCNVIEHPHHLDHDAYTIAQCKVAAASDLEVTTFGKYIEICIKDTGYIWDATIPSLGLAISFSSEQDAQDFIAMHFDEWKEAYQLLIKLERV